jgi:hypothetical protein
LFRGNTPQFLKQNLDCEVFLMKKFTETLVAIKSVAAFVFVAQIMMYVVGMMITGYANAMPFSFIWQALALSLITALLQYLCFDDRVIKKMRYSLRIVLFAVPLFAVLSSFALIGRWFPADRAGAWLLFAIIFLVVLVVITVAFEVYYRVTGKRYTDRLQSFRSSEKE